MAKKYINGENLIYALEHYEQQLLDAMEKITDIAPATEADIINIFKKEEENN